MNVPLTDGIGLRIYKELMHRESNCAAMWHVNYGPEALQKPPDPAMMMNLGQFTKRASVPMPPMAKILVTPVSYVFCM